MVSQISLLNEAEGDLIESEEKKCAQRRIGGLGGI